MFGIGMPELILIMAVALIVIGPKKLPDLARSLGKALGEFKKATNELKSSMGVDEELSDVKNAFDKMNTEVREIKDSVNINPLKTSGKQSSKDQTAENKDEPAITNDDKADEQPEDPLENLSNLGKEFHQLNEASDSSDSDQNADTPSPKDPPVYG